jgi:hypothetical protein
MGTPTCRSISAATVDDAVVERLLDALNPEEVALALAAADEVADRRARHTRAAELAVERARYEAERAERAFHACEPENRLVARSLETRWEQRLAALAEADNALAGQQAATPPLPSRAELEALTTDVKTLWHAPTTAPRDRKRLLRTLIADVMLLPEPDLGKARIGIRWHTGATDELVIARRLRVNQWRRTDPAAIDLARQHAHLSNRDLAGVLNEAGHSTGAGRPFDNDAVANLRHYHKVPPANLLNEGETTASDVARRLSISHGAVIHWIQRGWLPARRGLNNQWCIPFDDATEAACRQRIAASIHLPRIDDPTPANADERSVRQVADALEISTNVVYYWIEHNQITARRGPQGRWLITFTPDIEATCQQRVAQSAHIKPVPKPQTPRSTTKEAV